MRLGIGSYTYVWSVGVPGYSAPAQPFTHLDILERAVSLGVRVVQYADHQPLDHLTPGQLDELRRQAVDRGIEIEGGTSGIDRDHLLRWAEVAERVGAKLVRTVTDTAAHKPTPAECVDLLAGVGPELEQRGLTLALENHDRFKAVVLRKIVDDVASPRVGICLDTANSLGCSEGPDVVLPVLGPRACCLHVKEHTIRRLPHRFGFLVEGCPAGEGDLDLPRWLAALREYGRDVNVILELWPGPEPTIEAAMAKEERWAARSIAYLRRLITD